MSALLVVHAAHIVSTWLMKNNLNHGRSNPIEFTHTSAELGPADDDGSDYMPTVGPLVFTSPMIDFESTHSSHLMCRDCAEICIQLRRVFLVRRDEYRIDRIERIYSLIQDAAAERPPKVEPAKDIRGDSILIEFRCELGHTWWLELGNHKGTVLTNLILSASPFHRR